MSSRQGVPGARADEDVVPALELHRVREEWRARIAAEYTSAAITQHLTLWLIQAGAPPDLIDAGLVIVNDELVHSRLSHDVYVAAGGSEPPALDREALELHRSDPRVEIDILRIAVRVFCLGETVAVPLFRHLREECAEPVAKTALDRILRDEVRHRDFGWDLLDWMLATPIADEVGPYVEAKLPQFFRELQATYGTDNEVVANDDGAITPLERRWGLGAPRDYATILAKTIEKEYRPRFAAREISF